MRGFPNGRSAPQLTANVLRLLPRRRSFAQAGGQLKTRMSGSAAAEALAPHVAASHKLVVPLAAMLGMLQLNKANVSYVVGPPPPTHGLDLT